MAFEKEDAVYSPNDIMRQMALRSLRSDELENITAIKVAGQNFYSTVDLMGNGREISLAKTKIEEAVMWAVKHITR